MDDIMNEVVERLKNYRLMKRRIEFLIFELKRLNVLGEQELIECMALGARTEGQIKSSHLSDRTMAIALEYKGVLGRMEKETIINVNKELCSLEAEVDRLECYVSLLDTNEAAVIRLLYFERKSWSDTGEELKISRRTLFRYRKSALEVLASMYSPIL